MNINVDKFDSILVELATDVGGMCCESAVFIGEINGKPVRLSVMSLDQAEEDHDYHGTNEDRLVLS